jgi:hypothetical protein
MSNSKTITDRRNLLEYTPKPPRPVTSNSNKKSASKLSENKNYVYLPSLQNFRFLNPFSIKKIIIFCIVS